MKLKFIIAGFGGQGILSLGKIIARAAIKEDKFATYIPSYGAEMRGGTANCKVIISSQEIASPYINHPDVLIVFNQPSWDKFRPKLKRQSLVLLNSSLAGFSPSYRIKVIACPFTRVARELGMEKAANMIVLGRLWREIKFVKELTLKETIEEYFSSRRDIVSKNLEALARGKEL